MNLGNLLVSEDTGVLKTNLKKMLNEAGWNNWNIRINNSSILLELRVRYLQQ